MFHMIKLEIEDGKSSNVRAGTGISGKSFLLRKINNEGEFEDVRESSSLEDIELGDMVLVMSGGMFSSYIKTSPISEIFEQSSDAIKFKTGTSIYQITKEEDE